MDPAKIRCSACGHENRPTASYCGRCAAALTRPALCPACGVANPIGQSFCDACGKPLAAPTPSDLPTSIAAGRYQIRRLLGEGSKKRVYLAHDSRLERDVAVALVKTEGLDEAGLGRIRREARAMGRLGDHPNIVTVYDVGEEGAQPFIVSQYMAGGSIEDQLKRADKGRLPLEQTLRLADEICRALEHAHAQRILHRDLKPANVWLTAEGGARLGDFGLAVSLDRSRLTVEGMMVGTVAYMPPEQALGQAADARSDLYALGALLYEMITGRPPFLGDDAVSIISQHINTPPVAPSWHNQDVPRALEALTLRLLAKVPEDRPESARAVRETLAAISQESDKRHSDSGQSSVLGSQSSVNPLDRLAGGTFVGREQEMDQLRAALEDSLSGRGRLMLLVGEPGIGKTRTAEEIVTYARLRKMQVLWGRCYEGDGAPVYWPWVQAVRSYAAEHDPDRLRTEMGTGAADIAQVVSEVRNRLPDLPTPPPLEPEQARFRLFDSVTLFLKNAAKTQPLVLVLDDLHWADRPSLALLQFLAAELRGTRILVVGTYRDVELGRQHPLTETLARLAREELSERLVLRGLREQDIARFIEVTAGLQPPPGLVTALFRETEGNPFFVNEIVRLLVSEGRLQHPETVKSWSVGVPQSVREVIGRRLDRLSPTCNEVLGIASAMGRDFSLDVLVAVGAIGRGRMLEALEEAVAARVIVESANTLGRYSFAHALVRETLYEELSTTRRLRLHREIGEALEKLHAGQLEQHLSELAHHFFRSAQAGESDKAVEYAVRAAERAAALMAHEEAVRHYELALQAVELVQPVDESRRGEILLKSGRTLWRAGHYAEAKARFMTAFQLARSLGAAPLLAQAALGFGGRLAGFEAGIFDETLVRVLEEALVASGEDDSALRAQLMSRLAVALTFSKLEERRRVLALDAIAMARRVGDTEALSEVIRGAHFALWGLNDLEGQVRLASELIAVAATVGDVEAEMEGRIYRFGHSIQQGSVVHAEDDLNAIERLVARTRHPYYQWGFAVLRTMRALMEGRLAEAETLALAALHVGQERDNQNAIFIYGAHTFGLHRERGKLQDLEASVRTFAAQYPLLPIWRCALAVLLCETGRPAEARREIEPFVQPGFAELPRDFLWLASAVALGEVVATLGDPVPAQLLYDVLAPYERQNMVLAPVGDSWGATARVLGRLAGVLEQWNAATRHYEVAIELNRELGSPLWVARAEYDYAETLLCRGEPGDTEHALVRLNSALQTARELHMTRLLEKALALKLRAQNLASRRPAASGDSGKSTPTPTAGALTGTLTATAQGRNVFRHDGDYWTIVFEGNVSRIKHSKGVQYLAYLLKHPAREFHALELLASVDGPEVAGEAHVPGAGELEQAGIRRFDVGDAGEVLDTAAKTAYKRRLRELDEALEEAQTGGDGARAARIQEEIEILGGELARAVGLGGRDRRAGSPGERARLNITRAVKTVMQKVAQNNAVLGQHFDRTVKTGAFCSYSPDPQRPVSWTF